MSLSPTEFLKVATNTAEHFGFSTVDQIRKAPECKQCGSAMPHTINGTNKRLDAQSGLLCSGLATFCDEKLHALDRPVLFYTIDQKPRTGEPAVAFHIFNVERSIAEAILIQTGRALATDLGFPEHVVRINSLGDRDSVGRYSRELTNYLKKRLDTMPPSPRELMKEHPMLALTALIQEKHELGQRSPSPLEFLSDQSRRHFREIVEYLDMTETPYEIDSKMLGHHECYSDAIFSIDVKTEDESPSPLTITGGRFDEFAQQTTNRRTPAAGIVAVLNNAKAPARAPRARKHTPSVYIVQLGFGPKVKSLMLIDTLRQAGIQVFHNLASDSLSTQLRDAEARGVRYTLIIGQKEFVENTIILRDMHVRNQEFVDQDTLIKKLKRQSAVPA